MVDAPSRTLVKGWVPMDRVIYREFQNLRRLAWGFAALGVLLLVTGSFVDGPVGGWFVVTAIFSVFPTLFLAGVYRMNRIMLTSNRLEVGTESFRSSDFDFSFGVQPSLVLSPQEQAEVESRWPLPEDHEFRIAGGSWGRRLGSAMIVLREVDRTYLLAVFTRRPEVLDPLLTEWIEAIHEDGTDKI